MKVQQISIVLLVVLGMANCSTFDISSVSTCTQQSQTGVCTRWQQNGTVIETTGCFPAHIEVFSLQNGIQTIKRMDQIKIGDKILAMVDGEQIYSPVKAWLHKETSKLGQFIKVKTESGIFMASHFHNIATIDGSYAFAKDLNGKFLSNGEKVLSISQETEKGIYAPLTQCSNFYINQGRNDKILVHSYANIAKPEFYEPFVNTIISGWELIHGVEDHESIHPAAQWMRKTFNFLISQ